MRLSREVLSTIDMLVRMGVYGSRSEALRDLIEAGLERLGWSGKVAEAVERLFELEEREGRIPLELRGGLRQLLEERGRL